MSGARRVGLRLMGPAAAVTAFHQAREGIWAAAWYFFGYGWPVVGEVMAGVRPAALVVPIGLMVLAAVLGAAIGLRQARWASILLLIWVLFECLSTGLPLVRGVLNFALVINIAWAFTAVRSVAGAFTLARLMRVASASAQAEVFS